MTTSETGIAFIKQFETFSSKPYNDSGHLAWGYGHDQQPGENPPASITEDEALALLQNDLTTRFEPAVAALVPPDCTQGQFDALVDFAYNLGAGALRTMLQHGWDLVPEELPRWIDVDGSPSTDLKARRAGELALWNS